MAKGRGPACGSMDAAAWVGVEGSALSWLVFVRGVSSALEFQSHHAVNAAPDFVQRPGHGRGPAKVEMLVADQALPDDGDP